MDVAFLGAGGQISNPFARFFLLLSCPILHSPLLCGLLYALMEWPTGSDDAIAILLGL